MPQLTWRGLLALLLCLGACAATARRARTPSPPTAAGLRALRYTVDVDAAFSALAVELCFEGTPPRRLVYGARNAARFLRDVKVARAAAAPATVRDGQIELPVLAADSCVTYTIDVRAALDFDALMLAYPGEQSLLLASEVFLWRPERRSPELQSSVRFELPEGVRVDTPWVRTARAQFALDESAFAFTGHVLLGRFEELPVSAPGGQLRAVIMPGFPDTVRALIVPWLARAAAVASAPGAAFPVPNAQVIVVPTAPSIYPIHFGHTGRSGGASIVLFVPTDVDDKQLREDWIAVHEFSHLWHPFIRREDAWLSEGLATYLQEVLRVRAGLLAASEAWQRLYEGAQRGRETTQTLEQETRRMPFDHNYQRVYWAGAAIALMIDVRVRSQTEGRQSLDTLLAGVRAHSELFSRSLSAHEFLQALDAQAGLSACEGVANQYLNADLPDLAPLYRELGLPAGAGAGQEEATLAWVRDAIMQAP